MPREDLRAKLLAKFPDISASELEELTDLAVVRESEVQQAEALRSIPAAGQRQLTAAPPQGPSIRPVNDPRQPQKGLDIGSFNVPGVGRFDRDDLATGVLGASTLAGGALGARAGGFPGAMLGGMLGAGVGGAGAARIQGENMGQAGLREMAFEGGANLIAPGLGAAKRAIVPGSNALLRRAIVGRMPGTQINQVHGVPTIELLQRAIGQEGAISPQMRRLARDAADLKIPLGAQELSSNRLVSGFAKVFSKFPIVGTPLRKAQLARIQAIDAAHDNMMRSIQGGRGSAPGPLFTTEQRALAGEARAIESLRKGAKAKPSGRLAALKKKATEAPDEVTQKDLDSTRIWAPTYALEDVSLVAMKRGRHVYKKFRDESNRLYAKAEQLALDSGMRIPSARIMESAQGVLDDIDQLPKKISRKMVPSGVLDEAGQPILREEVTREPLALEVAQRAKRIAQEFVEIEPDMGPVEYKRLQALLNDEIGKAEAEGLSMKSLMDLKVAFQEAAQEASGDPEAIKAYADANKFFAEWNDLFRSRAGKGLERAEKGLLSRGATEELLVKPTKTLEWFMRDPDPDTLRNLRKILAGPGGDASGKRLWRNAVSAHINDAMWKSRKAMLVDGVEDFVLDIPAARRRLGIGEGASSARVKSLQVMLEGTGVRVKDVEKLFDVMEKAMSIAPGDVNQFALRRAILGGPGSLAKTFLPTASIAEHFTAGTLMSWAVGWLAATGSLVGLRDFGKAIADPAFVKNALISVNPKLTDAVRTRAVRRMMTATAGQHVAREALGLRTPTAEQFVGQAGEALGALRPGGPQ